MSHYQNLQKQGNKLNPKWIYPFHKPACQQPLVIYHKWWVWKLNHDIKGLSRLQWQQASDLGMHNLIGMTSRIIVGHIFIQHFSYFNCYLTWWVCKCSSLIHACGCRLHSQLLYQSSWWMGLIISQVTLFSQQRYSLMTQLFSTNIPFYWSLKKLW